MKTHALQGDGLNANDWHPELKGIKEIPKLIWNLNWLIMEMKITGGPLLAHTKRHDWYNASLIALFI